MKKKNFLTLSFGAVLMMTVTMQVFAVRVSASCVNLNDDTYCREVWEGTTRCYLDGSSEDACCTKPVKELAEH